MRKKKKPDGVLTAKAPAAEAVCVQSVLQQSWVDMPPADAAAATLGVDAPTSVLRMFDTLHSIDATGAEVGQDPGQGLYKQITLLQNLKTAVKQTAKAAPTDAADRAALLQDLLTGYDTAVRIAASPASSTLRKSCLGLAQAFDSSYDAIAGVPAAEKGAMAVRTVQGMLVAISKRMEQSLLDSSSSDAPIDAALGSRFVATLHGLVDLQAGRAIAAGTDGNSSSSGDWFAPCVRSLSTLLVSYVQPAATPAEADSAAVARLSHPSLSEALKIVPALMPAGSVLQPEASLAPVLLRALQACCIELQVPGVLKDARTQGSLAALCLARQYWRAQGLWSPSDSAEAAVEAATLLATAMYPDSSAASSSASIAQDAAVQLLQTALRGAPQGTAVAAARAAVNAVEPCVLTAAINTSSSSSSSSSSGGSMCLLCGCIGPALLHSAHDTLPSMRLYSFQVRCCCAIKLLFAPLRLQRESCVCRLFALEVHVLHCTPSFLTTMISCIKCFSISINAYTHTTLTLYMQALEAWLTRVTACVRAEQQQQHHSMPQWCSSGALDALLQQTSTLVMCTWESPFKAVAAIVPRVFQQLVSLQQVS
jgi:hypothetical protein